MADEMVKVTLDVQRMYRVNHEDRTAITVGPGEVEVPAWVAKEWAKPHPDQVKPSDELQALRDENERLTAEVNRLQDVVDQMTADIADAKAKPTTKAKK